MEKKPEKLKRGHLKKILDKQNTSLEREETAASLCFYMYAIGRENIGISTFTPIKSEQVEIIKRFKKVFELSYTRFDDLQKAEAQAREARIETALERVRSRTIMQERNKPHGTRNEELENELLNDIKDNEQKINHHGKRADAIVKGMLQHSRSSSNTKEPTDINALADEYLRLAYHGLRAKDNSFNATMKTDFDNAINKINITPQDIGRVLLNLYTNAFYAVNNKKKTADENYQPTISVQTKKINNNIEIKVSDNGNGIPENIINKIFQPFFTTKPTGQGTGLGLSLSYDIIKAHNGEIKMETKQGEGTIFIIQLPNV